MPAIAIPPSLMRERSASWSVMGSTVGPGQSATGAFYVGRIDGGGMWRAQWSAVNLRTADHIRCWRAISAIAENGVVPLIVPQCDKRHFPAPLIGGVPVYSGVVPHDDGAYFDDGSGYAQPVVLAVSVGSALLRATTIVIQFLAGSALRGGEIFSIDHPTQSWRRYEIKTVNINDDGDSVVTFRPPLREAVADGDDIEFDLPRCVMRLARSDAMDLDIEQRKFASPSVLFDEYIYPVTD